MKSYLPGLEMNDSKSK